MTRRLKAFAAVAGVLAAGVALIVWQRHPATEWIAMRTAGWAGLPLSQMKVAELDAGRAVLTDIRIGEKDNPDLLIDRLELTYDATSLRHERANHIAIAGLRLAARWHDGTLSLGSLDRLLTGGGSAGTGFQPPFESLSLTDGTITVMTPWGTTRIPIHGDLSTGGGLAQSRVTADFDVHLKEPGGDSALTAKGPIVIGLDTAKHEATLAIDMAFGLSGAGLKAENSRLQGTAHVAAVGDKIVVSADDCMALSLRQATFATHRLTLPLKICPPAVGQPLLTLQTEAAGTTLAFAAHLPAVKMDGSKLADTDITGTSPALMLSGDWKAGGWKADIGLDGGNLAVFDGRVGFDGVAATLTAKAGQSALEAHLDVKSLTLRDTADPAVAAPLVLSGEASLRGTTVQFAAKAVDMGGILDLTAEGHHDLAGNKGDVAFRTAPLTFAADRQPQSFLPLLHGHVTSVAGTMTATGNAAWGSSTLTSGLALSYTNGALSTKVADLAGVEARIAFDSLWPLSTPPGQTISIASADVGVPLADITARFQVLRDGAVLVERAGWPWAGGVIETRDTRLVPGAPSQKMMLEVRDVDIARALNLVDLDGLDGTGKLAGSIPVEVIGATPYIRNGRLSTGEGGGIISYSSESTDATLRNSGAGGELLADALKDFHYKEVVMEMDGETTGPVKVRLRVAGANPKLYDGYPIELNVNVEGDLGQLLRAGTAGNIDNIRREIEERRVGEPQ